MSNIISNNNPIFMTYVWQCHDGVFRSKTRMSYDKPNDTQNDTDNSSLHIPIPSWSYDGSSTGDAYPTLEVDREHYMTECILKPAKCYKDNAWPNRYIVWCINYRMRKMQYILNGETSIYYRKEPINVEMNNIINDYAKYGDSYYYNPQFGFEQEFFIIDPATNQPPYSDNGSPNNQLYYCGSNSYTATLEQILKNTAQRLIELGITVHGYNMEVEPGQGEIQVFGNGIDACHDLMMTRYILTCVCADEGYDISFANNVLGEGFNGSGCHTNFSTSETRVSQPTILCKTPGMYAITKYLTFMENYSKTHAMNETDFEKVFGKYVCKRLTGKNETSDWKQFTWSVGDRHTSVRVPFGVSNQGHGYIEDRRPGANVNPYAIVSHLLNTYRAAINS